MDYKALKEHVLTWLGKALPEDLTYHGLHHTEDVLAAVEVYLQAEGITDAKQQILLRTGAVLHDSGFAYGYQDHEMKGVEIARDLLPKYGYAADDIEVVVGLIMATKVPQSPNNHLEEILCDCDLDYLGRNDFGSISRSLFKEWEKHDLVGTLEEFDQKQIRFLEMHHYYTRFAKNERAPQKAKVLEKLKSGNN